MKIRITPQGEIVCLYQEVVEIAGKVISIQRASNIEPDERGDWWVHVLTTGSVRPTSFGTGTAVRLGPFRRRSEALSAEVEYLETNVI